MIALILLLAGLPCSASAQSKTQQKPDPDRLGMTCAQILQMTSSDWIAKVSATDTSKMDGQLRGIRVYGRCYDERTDRLAASLARARKGPSKSARVEFAEFDAALKDFAAKAIAGAVPPTDAVKSAYATLYEKQFRYIFYQEYEAKGPTAIKPTPPAVKPPAPAPMPPAHTDSTSPRASKHAATAQERARSDADPMTMAKNRFGKLLEPLPEEEMHDLHRAFGEVIGAHPISEQTRLAVYRYAILILEPPSATPFAPPPF